jgi:hypothetical protein
MTQVRITGADIENFRRRAQVCRAEAELTGEPGRRQERLDTALAYERMAERAKRHLGLAD